MTKSKRPIPFKVGEDHSYYGGPGYENATAEQCAELDRRFREAALREQPDANGPEAPMTDTLAVRAVSVALCRNDADCLCQRRQPSPCARAIARKGQEAARLVRAVSPKAPQSGLGAPQGRFKALPAIHAPQEAGTALPGL